MTSPGAISCATCGALLSAYTPAPGSLASAPEATREVEAVDLASARPARAAGTAGTDAVTPRLTPDSNRRDAG
ncbi:MAG: hypothetical protein M3P94_01660, partial [Chloroflexota bacterium]|nr:hypothetical protein [Chloroflexota bacterium]